MMRFFDACVRNRRLTLDVPTDLEEGAVLELVSADDILANGGDLLDLEERAERARDVEASFDEEDEGKLIDAPDALAELRALRVQEEDEGMSSETPAHKADPLTRLRVVGGVLARKAPVVLSSMISFLESMLETASRDIATERVPTAPVTLTAEQVLEAARARGVPAFAREIGSRQILLASLGLDMTDPAIHAALIEMYRHHELQLAHIGDVSASRADLTARGLRGDLVDESAIADGDMVFHTVVIS